MTHRKTVGHGSRLGPIIAMMTTRASEAVAAVCPLGNDSIDPRCRSNSGFNTRSTSPPARPVREPRGPRAGSGLGAGKCAQQRADDDDAARVGEVDHTDKQVRVAGYPALDLLVEVAVETTRSVGTRIPDAEGRRCQRSSDDHHDRQAAARE